MIEPRYMCSYCDEGDCYPARRLRLYGIGRICRRCFYNIGGIDFTLDPWDELPAFVPEHVAEIERLRAENAEKTEWIRKYGQRRVDIIGTPGIRCVECHQAILLSDPASDAHELTCQRGKWLKEGE
jgi:hypothetical protein